MTAIAFPGGSRRPPSATAEAIYEAAVDLIFRQGFEATTLRQIADVVGLKVGSLYNHIRSKEQLLYDIMRSVMTSLIDQSGAALAASPDDPRLRLRAFLSVGIEFHARNQHAAFIGNTELRALEPLHRRSIVGLRDDYQRQLEELVRAVAATGPESGVQNVKLASYAAVAIINHVASWYQPWGELGLDDVVDGLLSVYLPIHPPNEHPRQAAHADDHRARGGEQ